MSVDLKDLAESVSYKLRVPRNTAQEAIYDLFNRIVIEAKAGNKVFISDFGEFNLIRKPTRKARNPKTGEDVQVEAYSKITFKPARAYRKMR